MMFHHPDGRWIEAILEPGHRLTTYQNPGGGVIFGRDPSCDIVLTDDGIEDFHAHYYARGHHQYLEVIAGDVDDTRGRKLSIGESSRGSWTICGWTWGRLEEAPNLAAIRTAMSIADDATAEGRHDAAAAILAEVGYRRVKVAKRTGLPERLQQSEWILRVRVENGNGPNEIHAVGARERLKQGITVGGTKDCDVVIAAAGQSRVRIVEENNNALVYVCEAGTMTNLLDFHKFKHEPGKRHAPYSRWERFAVGDAIAQLCRWPMRDELLL